MVMAAEDIIWSCVPSGCEADLRNCTSSRGTFEYNSVCSVLYSLERQCLIDAEEYMDGFSGCGPVDVPLYI